MQISMEGKIGILLGLLGLAGAGAIMIAPDKLWIGWTLIGLAAAGGIGLGFHHFGRTFIGVPIIACVLSWDYWYYTNVLSPPAIPRTISPSLPPPSSSSQPTLIPVKPQLVSTYRKMLAVCDKPKPEKTPSMKERKADLARYIDFMKKMFGWSVEGNIAEDELTLSVSFDSPTGVHRQTIFIKRAGDKLFLSITNEADNPIGALFGLVALDGTEDFAKQMMEKIEQLAQVGPGKCKYL